MTPSQSAHRRDRRRRNGYCMALASGSGVADLWTPRSPLLPSLETRYLRNEPNRAWPWPFQLISLHKRNFNLSLGHGNSSRRVRWILRWVAKKRPLIVLVEQFRIIRFPLFSPSCLARLCRTQSPKPAGRFSLRSCDCAARRVQPPRNAGMSTNVIG